MKKVTTILLITAATVYIAWFIHAAPIQAEEPLRYSCSAQVYEAFESERLKVFTEVTGVKVELYVSYSSTCVNRLMNGFSDIASTTRGLHYSHKEAGYVETQFCRDPLAVIVKANSHLVTLSKKELRDIFLRNITNWRELGGPDQPVVLAVPGVETGAYKNFHLMVMKMKDIQYDYMSYQSTQIIGLVQQIAGSISFIARGAIVNNREVKAINIDGISATHPEYPLSQEFSFVTRGEPSGAAKALVDFTFSERSISIMKKRGMVPIKR
jgi:ABC-type phosphate transport system substrate-binding protein